MADILSTDFNYTYDGKLSTEVLLKPSIMTPDLMKVFTVMLGIKNKQQISIAGILDKVTKAYDGCGGAETGSGLDITNKTIETKRLKIKLSQCADAFEGTILSEVLKSGVDYNDIQGTDIEKVALELLKDVMRRDNFRIAMFGDTSSVDPDYNMLDGMFPTLINNVGSGCVTRIGAALGNTALASGVAYARLKQMYDEAPLILQGIENSKKVFIVTQSVYRNLLASYESLDSGSDVQFALVQDGTQKLQYRGVDVIPYVALDQSLVADHPLGANIEHLILYTTPSNHIIGLDRAADQGSLKVWYDDKDEKVYFKGQYNIGYQFIHCDLQAIAY